MTRPADDEPAAEAAPVPLDYPCDERGLFSPAHPELWLLWRDVASHRGWRPGCGSEVSAVRRWEDAASRREWNAQGRPFPRSEWERNQQPWLDALAEVERAAGLVVGRLLKER